MAPPVWVHELARLALSPRMADRGLQHGLLFNSPESALAAGYIDEDVSADEDIVGKAVSEIQTALKVPWLARSDGLLEIDDPLV